MDKDIQKQLRKLPSVDRLLRQQGVEALLQEHGRDLTTSVVQDLLSEARKAILAGEPCPRPAELAQAVGQRLSSLLKPSLYAVINATGIIIHTNLGRAPLSQAAQEAMRESSAYCNLEFEVAEGRRGSRYVHAEDLLCRLTGAEAALVVNNDAGAVLLILSALAKGREVIISRGQLVEIGGGFRIPEVMAQSGAHLVEVGTTNRTYLSDYEAAISENTRMMLHVHSSNFRVIGFVEQTPLRDLVQLAHSRDLLAVDDLGSGALLDTAQFGLSHEPTVQESLACGVDVMCFSGDKLLGGPQAGILLGNKDVIAALKRHPLTRALRVSKSILAALQATLLHYLKGEAVTTVPVWQMMAMESAEIEARARDLAAWLRAHSPGGTADPSGLSVAVIEGRSKVGGGSLPEETLPTHLVALRVPSVDQLAQSLRLGSPPVISRIESDALVLDLRTVLPSEEAALRQALEAAL